MGKVRAGDPLTIASSDWNPLLDVADKERRGLLSAGVPRAYQSTGTGLVVPVKNSTEADVDRWGAVAIDGPLYTPTDNEQGFVNTISLDGVAMTSGYFGRFAVYQAAAPDGTIRPAMIQGITQVQLDVVHEDHDRCDVDPEGGSLLVSAFYGAGEILWKESGTGTKWAIIRIGSWYSPDLIATAAADIAVDGSGNATIQWGGSTSQTVTAHLDWMAGTQGVSNGDELLIRFFKDENKFRIIGASCAGA